MFLFDFDKIREVFRDHGRDELCAHLRALGIQPQMSVRGRPEEKITGWGKSLGIIDIQDALIRWIDIRREHDPDNNASWYIGYGVPDSRITAGFHKVTIRTKRIKKFPLVGKVIDLRWEGGDFGLGLTERLNLDVVLNKLLMDTHDMEIGTYPEHSCWMLEVTDVRVPPKQAWDCYQAIARHLLGTPLPTNT